MRSLLNILYFFPLVTAFSLHFDSETNTYKDLLISISPDLPETHSLEIIENIKTWVTEGSNQLYSTSQGWAHFSKINILIPASWTSVNHTKSGQNVHEDAEIRVESRSPLYGDTPTTVQNGECGEQGDFIQVSHDFLTTHIPDPQSPFGPPGQVFLYEWSRFRYGVFSEHGYPGDPLYPMFYNKQSWTAEGMVNEVKPNLCTNVEPEGSMHSMSGGSCLADQTTGLPKQDCYFTATGPNTLQTSIMALPYLPGASQWCDQTEDKIHNDELPTKHNAMCGGQSVTEVIMQHLDFAGFQPSNISSPPPPPVFNIISPVDSDSPFVFILDCSGSMSGNKIKRMKQGVKRFLEVDAEYELELPVGLVSFDSSSTIAHEILPVANEEARDEIIEAVMRFSAGGGTYLGAGLRKGLEALENYGMETGGGVIVLTDGMISDSIEDETDEVISRNVRACTIAFGNNADPSIEELAIRTNGKAYFVSDNGGQDEINNALSSCLDFLPSIKTENKTVVITQKTFSNVDQMVENVTIDNFTGRSVSVQIDYDVSGELKVHSEFDGSSSTISGTDVITFSYQTVSPGSYGISVSSGGRTGSKINFLTLLVESMAPQDVLPITTDCWTNVGARDVVLTGENPDKLVIFGRAMQGLSPVLAANLTASITSDGQPDSLVSLKDDGVSPDSVRNDGIYSAYFNDFQPNQGESRHSLVCSVAGTDETMVVSQQTRVKRQTRAFPSSPSPSTPVCCGSSGVTEDTPVSPTGSFTRSRSGGVISVGRTGADTNIFPPGQIRDLRVGDFDEDHFSLSFTSPGADLNTGNISDFIIFYSENKTELNSLNMSSSVARVTMTDLYCTDCTLDPLPPFSKVELTLNLNSFIQGEQVFFRVLAIDEGNKTSLSNRANIILARPTMDSESNMIHPSNISVIFVSFFVMLQVSNIF